MSYIVMDSHDTHGLEEGDSYRSLDAAKRAAREWSSDVLAEIDVVDSKTATVEASFRGGVDRLA